ncbi:Enoyl-CoA delta isomerase 2, mitochondrial [Cryptotermes secundus]|uniref:Enoyl-CoA delta isomerase 2, mitochondrial n=1 Tax=Cryptotermes secundus TaxID=105785 RepID=A0A2J7REP9_9NEOP|nr:enoyl-CoA delta isomerase 2, mitochondrial [Cryptotermes secundus]XP_023701983.1 enoyl-CoA delta isomerase 2, mitochondrial [Cryptotermes secundus]XP_023701984.1 enoyl-CoA delta isomerase 2, mitochondrial [Cryptotermes secundus]PNF39313.1 Enoyl-CoA delta isomerase 2, mitochondrial [Cryptotermes secundus]PNF39314.1 Enoyl-CoA delta isomerase 2, mitochondrial [Cryptotermes secundus]PNF39315.1 Enoyl-CoA delta isomerase 2, mitochondrial [Cryptotermes secundus]
METQTPEGLEVTLRNGLLIIKFNRPSHKNAITVEMYIGLTRLLKEAAVDDRVVITALTGAGDFYSSGNDISKTLETFSKANITQAIDQSCDRVRDFVSAFIDFPKILVAVVNGPAFGIAVTILGLCDVVYASDKAYFCTPFTKLGLVAEGCSSYTFPRIMGSSKASEMLYFGYKMDAHEAKECGLVSKVFPHATFEQEVWPKLEQFVKMPKQSMMYSKHLARALTNEGLHKANEAEITRLKERLQSEESMTAVLEFFNRKSKM